MVAPAVGDFSSVVSTQLMAVEQRERHPVCWKSGIDGDLLDLGRLFEAVQRGCRTLTTCLPSPKTTKASKPLGRSV
jgi:hypothetical protein